MPEYLSAMRDPVGVTVRKDERVLRGIREEFTPFFQDLLTQDHIQRLLGKSLIQTSISTDTLPGYGLTLEHPLISPRSYVYEWPLTMLFDAALLTLDLCLELNQHGNILKDANPWNILFQAAQPTLVDFTSIMPNENDILWVAYDQFMHTFFFPLLVGAVSNGNTVRSMLLSNQDGLTPQATASLLPWSARVKYPWLQSRLYIPLRLMNMLHKTGQDKEIQRYTKGRQYSSEQRENFFIKLKRDLLSLKPKHGQSMWSQYYQDMNSFFSPDQFQEKQRMIANLLDTYQPKTVVDMGCNVGGYSILAAQSGAKVAAFDTDEDSISMLYRLAQEKELDILSLVGNVLYPSPAAGWRACEFPSMPTRLGAEMGFALALEHHLAITQNQTFERIVQTLDEYCEKWLVTEFIPIEDPRVQELLLTSRRDMSWYTLDNFISALKKSYARVDTFPSHPPGRTLCFCQK